MEAAASRGRWFTTFSSKSFRNIWDRSSPNIDSSKGKSVSTGNYWNTIEGLDILKFWKKSHFLKVTVKISEANRYLTLTVRNGNQFLWVTDKLSQTIKIWKVTVKTSEYDRHQTSTLISFLLHLLNCLDTKKLLFFTQAGRKIHVCNPVPKKQLKKKVKKKKHRLLEREISFYRVTRLIIVKHNNWKRQITV